MHFSALLPLLALSASALPTPNALLEPVERDVGVLTCETVWTGPLSFAGIEGSAVGTHGYAAFVGKRDGRGSQILLTRTKDGKSVEPQMFNFKKCTSDKPESFMGYGGDSGHVSPVNAPNHCITRRDERFVSEVCSNSDDSGQLLQYFALGDNKSLTYLGREQAAGGPVGVFGTSIGKTPQKKIAIIRGGKNTVQMSLSQNV